MTTFQRAFVLLFPILLVCSATRATAEETPSQAYMVYHEALMRARSFADIIPYLGKATRASVEKKKESERQGVFALVKFLSPEVIRVVRETINGDQAVLEVEEAETGSPSPSPGGFRGTIEMVREEGRWKVGHEKWDKKVQNKEAGEATQSENGAKAGMEDGDDVRSAKITNLRS